MNYLWIAGVVAAAVANAVAQRLPLDPAVKPVCTIAFDKNTKQPARVEDDALSCLEQAAQRLKQDPSKNLVIVGTSHPVLDHEEKDHGMERAVEDESGEDIRFEDVAAYRAVNTKAYLTKWLSVEPSRIIPTTDEYALGRQAKLFLVPGDANFFHNYLRTTATNENPCTVRPCYPPNEDTLTAQTRDRIKPSAKP